VEAVVPLVFRRQQVLVDGARQLRSSRGMGDPVALLKVGLFGGTMIQRSAQLGLVAGFKLPLARSGGEDRWGEQPPGLQPGSGAADLLGGLYYSVPAGEVPIFGSVLYRATRANALGFRFGDSLSASLDARPLQLYPFAPTAGLRFGFNRQDLLAGVPQQHSGGARVAAHVGAAWFARTDLSLSLDGFFPLYDGLAAHQLSNGISVVGGVFAVF
jgi:hypothetical protein